MFESLGEKLSNAFKRFRNKGKLTEADVKAGMREIKLALLEADVNFKVVRDFINIVSERAVGTEVLESLLPAQQIVKIVNEDSANVLLSVCADGWSGASNIATLNATQQTLEGAILVGSETFLQDSPTLTPRHYHGTAPQPVVLDRRNRLTNVAAHWLHLHTSTVEETLQILYEQKLQSVIVEGGRQILDAFIVSGLYDEVRILRSPQTLGSGLPAPEIPPIAPNRLTIIEP